MSSFKAPGLFRKLAPATMKIPDMKTSFDEICMSSVQRHFTIYEMVFEGLGQSRPQSGQIQLEMQKLLDEVTELMEGYLLGETERSKNPLSAEFFAERWDYMLWSIYRRTCNVDEEFPYDFPEYQETYARPPAPEHLRILETRKFMEPVAQSVSVPSSFSAPVSSSPNAEAAQNAPDQDMSIARPVREDLSKPMQDRVLPLHVRQGIWERHFIDCEMQEGAEPLQLQIPRNKRNKLLVGDKIVDGERMSSMVFDRLRNCLPHAIDIIYQDPPDGRFGFTLLYIGLKSAWQDDPHAPNSVLALHLAWATLFPWAKLVKEGYNIDVATFAQWYTSDQIEVRRHRTLNMDRVMEKAVHYVEDIEVPRDPLVAQSHRTAPHSPQPKPVQHHAKMSAERSAENEKLSAIMASAAQTQRAGIIARVADIIEGTRTDPASTALDWKVLRVKLSQFVVETGDFVSRATWVYEGCAAWRKENIVENSEEQARFDKELSSWFTDFLGFLGSRK